MKSLFDFEGHRKKIAKKFWDMSAEGSSLEDRKKMLDEEKGTLESHVAEKLREKVKSGVETRRSLENLPGFENFEAIDISDKIPEKLKLYLDFLKVQNESSKEKWEEFLDFGGIDILRETFEKIAPGEIDNPHNLFHGTGAHTNKKEFGNDFIEGSDQKRHEFLYMTVSTYNLYWYYWRGRQEFNDLGAFCIISPDSNNFKEFADTALYDKDSLPGKEVGRFFGIDWDNLTKEDKDVYYGKYLKESGDFDTDKDGITDYFLQGDGDHKKHNTWNPRYEKVAESIKVSNDTPIILPPAQDKFSHSTIYAMNKHMLLCNPSGEVGFYVPNCVYPKKDKKQYRFTDFSKYIIDLPNGMMYRYKDLAPHTTF